MTRLDSVIRRLEAQRRCLDWAVAEVASRPGLVFELGLGNGRTYDHLRDRLPGREIYVFERQVAAHPGCIPDSGHLILGDVRETLPRAVRLFCGRALLVHSDIGSGDEAANLALGDFMAAPLAGLLAPGGVLISSHPIALPRSEPLALPEGVPEGRYFLSRYYG